MYPPKTIESQVSSTEKIATDIKKANLLPIIYHPPEKKQYLYNSTTIIENTAKHRDNIAIPLVVDTEYTGDRRMGITVQIKGIHQERGVIFDHRNLQQHASEKDLQLRHKPIRHDFAVLDYLSYGDRQVRLIVKDRVRKTDINGQKLPFCQFDIYAHFALAELLMMFTGEARKKVADLIKHGKSRSVEMTRRLRTTTKGKKGFEVSDAIELPFHLDLDNQRYRVKIRIIDSCALHGIASYKAIASATGVELPYKETLSQNDLENMLDTYFEKPEDFDNYALGDLEVYRILANNSNLFEKVYKSLGVEQYFQPPKLTIGSTVRDLFKASLYNKLGIHVNDREKQDKLSEYLSYASPSRLKKATDSTRCLLAKVFGGRCRNNRPTDIKNDSLVTDNDIAGAYGNGLRNQIYPIGKPVIEDFKDSKYNRYQTLRQWLKKRKYGKEECELVDGLWTAVVSNKEIDPENNQWDTLNYQQDFLISWFGFKFTDVADMETDTDQADAEIKPKTGNVKILNNQVIHAVITSDFLEWLDNICSPRQRKELLNNLYIETACYYPSYSKVNSFEELIEIGEYWQGINTTTSREIKVKSRKKKLSSGMVINTNQEPTFWLGLDLGKLIVDDLLAWRTMHKKLDGKKSPMDVLFKLCTNTLYGDFTSPYFDISNTVVGNNITARCRAMAWYMEKGHYAYQTITDGGQIDPNKVCYPKTAKRKVTALSVTNLYRVNPAANHVLLKPLDNCDRIESITANDTSKLKVTKNGVETIIDEPKEWLQQKLFEHLQTIFPNVSVLHKPTTKLEIDISDDRTPIKRYSPQIGMFSFEIKDIYTRARFHGTSNYLLANERETKIAMRSYETKRHHQSFSITNNYETVQTEFYDGLSPSTFFLQQLNHPNRISRSKVFIKKGILKLNDWKNNADKWLDKGYVCGDTIEKTGILREFSLSQFTYQTIAQYLAIEKEVQRNKRRYNQSYEGYFINDDGTLDYQLMITEIDTAIANGVLSINKYLDKSRHRTRDIDIKHPEINVYQAVKAQANGGAAVHTSSQIDDEQTIAMPEIFEGNLDEINW
jgi:hypothetical protein